MGIINPMITRTYRTWQNPRAYRKSVQLKNKLASVTDEELDRRIAIIVQQAREREKLKPSS